jgi:hypothetical protein
MSSTHLTLRPFNDFERDMAEFAAQFDGILRELVPIALYSRAGQRMDLENLRLKEKSGVPLLRKRRMRAEQKRKNLQNVIKSLNKLTADGISESTEAPAINQAKVLLRRAVEDLKLLEDYCAAHIHPDFRTESEKKVTRHSTPEERWSLIPGFGVAKVDQLFIASMEEYLKVLVTQKGSQLSSAEIDRVIIATVKAAFGEYFTIDKVKTARRRLPTSRQQ